MNSDGVIGGIQIMILIAGLIQAMGSFGLDEKWGRLIALILGAILVGLDAAIDMEVITGTAVTVIQIVVIAIAGALAAVGYLDLVKKTADRVGKGLRKSDQG